METQTCSVCGTENPPTSRFCVGCGNALAVVQERPPAAPAEIPAPAPIPARQPAARPVQTPPGPSSAGPQRIGAMGEGGVSAASIWGPFAGYGTRGRHVAWLLDNLADRADALRNAVTRRFAERRIPAATVEPRLLTGKGIVVERRPYHLIRRGVVTAGLYIARFGQDLYISQVTYAKGAISWLRVALLGLMVLFQLFMMFGYASTLSNSLESTLGGVLTGYGSGGGGGAAFGVLACCIGPVGVVNTLALMLAGAHMIYKYFTEKDPWMLLRAPLNEFNQDDLVALEKAVEETVRQSLDVVGIDKGLLPPASEYGSRQRLI